MNLNKSNLILITLLIMFLTTGLVSTLKEIDPDNQEDLLLLYHFNNDSTVGENDTHVYDFAQRNNGTIINVTINRSFGKVGGSFNFESSSSKIELKEETDFDFIKNLTITMWIYPRDLTNDQVLFGKWNDGSSKAYAFEIYQGNDLLFISSADGSANDTLKTTTNPLSESKWYHVAVTFDSGIRKIYVDGKQIVNDSVSSTINTNDDVPFIGRDWDNGKGYNGSIDELAIFNKSLSAEEIESLYNTPSDLNFSSPTLENGSIIDYNNTYINLTISDDDDNYAFVDFDSSLVGWWRFDTTNGDGKIVDESVHGNNGTKIANAKVNSTGYWGDGLYLDGTGDYVDTGDSSVYNFSKNDEFTISAWIKGNTDNKDILSKMSDVSPFEGYKIATGGTGEVEIWLIDGNGNRKTRETTGLDFVNGNWYHVVFTYNGSGQNSGMKLYINGSDMESSLTEINAAAFTTDIQTTQSLRIGTHSTRNWDGAIDDVLIFNRTLDLEEIRALYNATLYNYQNNFTKLHIGKHTIKAYSIDTVGNKNESQLREITVRSDAKPPIITLNNPENSTNTSSQNIWFNFTINEDSPASSNCSLYVDSTLKDTNNSVLNNTITSLNASELSEGAHDWYVSCSDTIGNTNDSIINSFYIDITPPEFTNTFSTPNSTSDVDPNSNVTFNSTITDNRVEIDTAILQYHNGTTWLNSTMSPLSGNEYNSSIITLVQSEINYTFNIWANDTLGNSNHSLNQTLSSYWDCDWTSNTDLGQTAGFDEIKQIGDIIINNTGDSQHSNNNCALGFRLTYDLTEGRIYVNTSYLKPSDTFTVQAKENLSLPINASFLSEVKEESAVITITESFSRSSTHSRNVSATLVSTTGGPYLFEEITSSPSTLSLTFSNFTLDGYIRNLVGDDTINNTAYNVSLNWSLPSGFTQYIGNMTLALGNMSNSSRVYNNITISFNESNLEDLSPGVVTVYLYGYGHNSTGSIITHSDSREILTQQTNITLECYNISDGIYVTSCGSLDGDYTAPSTGGSSTSTSSGGGGGGGAAPSESLKTSADFQLVRGKENEVKIIFTNRDQNQSITDIKFSVTGKISKYIEIEPKELLSLPPKQNVTLIIRITSPTYIEIGKQEITAILSGKKGASTYTDRKSITLEIHELSQEEAKRLLNESTSLVKEFRKYFSSDEIDQLLNESISSMKIFDYEKVRDNHAIIKQTVESALEAKEIINSLQELMKKANEKGIDTSSSSRILKLAILSLERNEFDQALQRAKEAQVTYALEVKGEIGRIIYYVKNNPKEISFAAIFLSVFTLTSYKVTRLQILRRKIKNLREEEKIIHELIRAIQIETFEEKTMSMEEYEEALIQYEKRLSEIIQELINLENQRAHALMFTPKQKKLKIERDKIISLIKEVQSDYLEKGILETRSYELKIESYNKRLGEIDESLATLEAKQAFRKVKIGGGKK